MKRTYSKEFKIAACELVVKDGIKYAVVAEKMGINKDRKEHTSELQSPQ